MEDWQIFALYLLILSLFIIRKVRKWKRNRFLDDLDGRLLEVRKAGMIIKSEEEQIKG